MDLLTEKELDLYYQTIFEVLKEKASNMSKTAFDLWFTDFHLISISDEKVVLATPDNLKRKIIVERFYSLVQASVWEALDFKPKVEIICDGIKGAPKITDTVKSVKLSKGKFASTEAEEEEETEEANEITLVGLNKEYTFENFVVGSSNKLAHACSVAVAKDPGGALGYNPLFIYGPSGLGKTHLMYAIANEIHAKSPEKSIICIKSEDFLNELVECVSKKNMAAFREKYRKIDVLLLDDVQFISGKQATQLEFFHTFDTLYEEKKQMVITCDRPPKELHTLEERFQSRFSQGMIVDVQPPEYELRLAILKKKAEKANITVPNNVIVFLAEKLNKNIREIEGALKKVAAISLFSGKDITIEMVKNSIPEYFSESKPVAETVDAILDITARKYDVTVEAILGKSRTKSIKTARNVAMYVISNVLDVSLNDIGKMMDRDHSTVFSNIKSIEAEIRTDDKLNNDIFEIIAEIKN